MMTQENIFLQEEGDAWFRRNESKLQTVEQVLQSEDVQFILKTLSPFQDNLKHVLEIGCSNGLKLEAVCRAFNAAGDGVDPSSVAVQVGNARKKEAEIDLRVGMGHQLPYPSSSRDLIHFAFCLLWFDRNLLIQSLAEADRVLRPGGFMVITDFDPGSCYKKIYAHKEGVFSYKQDYSAFYTSSPLYHLVGKHSYSHEGPSFHEFPDERVATSILYKEQNPYITHQGG